MQSSQDGPIDAPKTVQDVRQETYPLPERCVLTGQHASVLVPAAAADKKTSQLTGQQSPCQCQPQQVGCLLLFALALVASASTRQGHLQSAGTAGTLHSTCTVKCTCEMYLQSMNWMIIQPWTGRSQ
jgi:hypothetical protein